MALRSINEAVTLATARGILPTAMRTAQLRRAFAADLRARSVFSAQVTSQAYLRRVKLVVERRLQNLLTPEDAKTLLLLELRNLGYDPLNGFPDGSSQPNQPGGITDLSSDARLDLILRTQEGVLLGQARRLRETDAGRVAAFPAWELIRLEGRETPRDWAGRWAKVGGSALPGGELMAWKWDGIWKELGDSGIFEDGLDTEFAPYAFNSGMGIREVSRPRALRVLGPADSFDPAPLTPSGGDFKTGLEEVSREQLEALAAQLDLENPSPEQEEIAWESRLQKAAAAAAARRPAPSWASLENLDLTENDLKPRKKKP